MSETPSKRLPVAELPWRVIDDGVMGGVSRGRVAIEDKHLVFSGQLSLENNGGFSSIRATLDSHLAGCEAVTLTVRGDGRRYQFRLRHHDSDIAWITRFDTQSDWSTVTLPFEDFQPGFRGRSVPGAGPVQPAKVQQIGFLLADRKPGPFLLEVSALELRRGRAQAPENGY